MNAQNNVVERIIKLNNGSCPEFTYDNPLIDKDVARALSRSVIKVITNPEHDIVNAKLKSSILINLHEICLNKTKEHVPVNDHIVEEILRSFVSESESDDNENIGKKLDLFLMNNLKNIKIKSKYKARYNPETVQALLNLGSNVEWLKDDFLLWDEGTDSRVVFKNIFNERITDRHMIDNMSVCNTSFIEKIILTKTTELLSEDVDSEEILSSQDFLNLINKSSVSPKCFQITTNILNHVLIKSEFNVKLLKLIRQFILKIKSLNNNIPILYPKSIQPLVLLLDMDVDDIPSQLMRFMTEPVFKSLNNLHVTNKHDLILILSHYPVWFDLYINNNKRE